MTDKQKEIFKKMMEGRVEASEVSGEIGWFVIEDSYHPVYGQLYQLISKHNKEWDDYIEAWKEYERVPLIRALK